MRTKFETLRTGDSSLTERRSFALLETHAGLIGRLKVRAVARRETSRTLGALTPAQARKLERAVVAELSTTEQLVVGAALAQRERALSSLVEDAAAETGAAQTRLTALGSADRIGHVARCAQTYAAIDARVKRSEFPEGRAEALHVLDEADLVADIETTNARTRRSKEFVELLNFQFPNSLKQSLEDQN